MTSTNPTNNETQKPKQTNSNRKSKTDPEDEKIDLEDIPEFKNQCSSSSSVEKISNALAVCICISKYTKSKDLPGTKIDRDITIKLWHGIYGYQVLTTTDETFVDNDKFWKILKTARDELKKNNGTKHDALILVLSGHGNENGSFLTSDNNQQKMSKIRAYFDGSALPNFAQRPKIFFHACRGREEPVVVKIPESYGTKVEVKNASANFTVVYGNVEGYTTFEDRKKGGILIRAMNEIFRVTNNTDTLLQMVREMRKCVAKKSEARMVVEVQETSFYDISFAVNESGKWCYLNENEEWITYKNEDQGKISKAWDNREKVVELDEIRKVELCYDDMNQPRGTQICIKKGGNFETDVSRKDMTLVVDY